MENIKSRLCDNDNNNNYDLDNHYNDYYDYYNERSVMSVKIYFYLFLK